MSEENTVYDVVGIGNAIVDVLAKVGDAFLKERNVLHNYFRNSRTDFSCITA